MNLPSLAKCQRGASLIAAIFLLLLFAALAAYMLWFGSIQQRSTALDVTGARALQAARSGIEWGAFRALRSSPRQCSASETFSLTGAGLAGFTVHVTCKCEATDQLGAVVSFYQLRAVACNDAACPSSSPGDAYVERVVSATLNEPIGCPP